LRSFANLVVPDKLTPETGFWAVMFTLVFTVLVLIVLVRKKSHLMWFGSAFAYASFMVYLFHFPERVISTTHRYATIPFVGVSIFIGGFLAAYFKNKKWLYRATFVVVLLNVIQMNVYSIWNIRTRNVPTRNFYRTLTKTIPVLPRKSAIYIDMHYDTESRRLRSEFFSVGSAPDMSAIAYYYGIDRYDLYLPENFGELLSLVKQGKVGRDRFYTFYFDAEHGLENTTSKTRESLFGGSDNFEIKDLANINIDYSSPIMISFEGETSLNLGETGSAAGEEDLGTYISYLQSKNNYYDRAKAIVSSEWKYQEGWNVMDGDYKTSWMSNRFEWLDRKAADVVVDLGVQERVGAVKMHYDSDRRIPLEYEYFCSLDGESWNKIGKFYYLKNENNLLVDRFDDVDCRYVKLLVTKTELDDSPQISELEVVEGKYSALDFELADRIENSPGLFAEGDEEVKLVEAYLRENGVEPLLCYVTNKINPGVPECVRFEAYLGVRNYSVVIPASGTKLVSVKFERQVGINFTVSNASFKILTFDELEEKSLIHDYIHEY